MVSIRIDRTRVRHRLPATRGVMTEWMFAADDAGPVHTVDPTGQQFSYGSLLPLEEADYALAAATGANTIRLAVEHASLEDEHSPHRYLETGFRRLEQLLEWCASADLDVILDLHNPLGRAYGGDRRLWEGADYQDRFVAVWGELVRRVGQHPRIIAYEPLNEPEPPANNHAVWNKLARRLTDEIRRADSARPIIIDTIGYANPARFDGLEPTGDPNTMYSFHWYAPTRFHYQKRPHLADQGTYHYPDHYQEGERSVRWDRRMIRQRWQPALDFAEQHGVPLFCGEFGCVGECPEMEDMVWLLDVVSLLDELGIGWTYFHHLFRTREPYWSQRYDCNLFVRDMLQGDGGQLRPLARKVSLLGDLMKLSGDVLEVATTSPDPLVLAYAVRLDDGGVRVYLSNASRHEAREIHLVATHRVDDGGINVARMAVGSGGFAACTLPPHVGDGWRISTDPLTIHRIDLPGVAVGTGAR